MDGETNFKPTSLYNESVNILTRLNSIWEGCHTARRNGNLKLWNTHLDSAWSELSSDEDLTEEEDKKDYNLYNKMIVKYKNKRNVLYQILGKKEIFLKAFQNRQGKGNRHKEDDEGL